MIRPVGRWHGAAPVVMLAMVVVTALHLPPQAALAASRPGMDRLARAVLARPGDVYAPRRVGLFWAQHIDAVPGGMTFVADDRDAHSRVGFAYLPRLDPRQLRFKSYHSLGQGWWDWKQGG